MILRLPGPQRTVVTIVGFRGVLKMFSLISLSGLMTDVVKTNAEYKKMTVGAISQDEYLRVSPVSTTVFPTLTFPHQLRETDSCRQHQMLEVRVRIFTLGAIH